MVGIERKMSDIGIVLSTILKKFHVFYIIYINVYINGKQKECIKYSVSICCMELSIFRLRIEQIIVIPNGN